MNFVKNLSDFLRPYEAGRVLRDYDRDDMTDEEACVWFLQRVLDGKTTCPNHEYPDSICSLQFEHDDARNTMCVMCHPTDLAAVLRKVRNEPIK